MLRIWNNLTPYVQITGFLVAIVPIGYVAFSFWKDASAYGGRLDSLETWRGNQEIKGAIMMQKIDDIHDYLIPKK